MEHPLSDIPSNSVTVAPGTSRDVLDRSQEESPGRAVHFPERIAAALDECNAQKDLLDEYREIETLAISASSAALVRAHERLCRRAWLLLSHCFSVRHGSDCRDQIGIIWLNETRQSNPQPADSGGIGEGPVFAAGRDSNAWIVFIRTQGNLLTFWRPHWQPRHFSDWQVPIASFPEVCFFNSNAFRHRDLTNVFLCGAGEESSAYCRQVIAERRMLLLAVMLGTLQAMFNYVLDYSKRRITFGRAICHHQAVALKLADIATGLYTARLLCHDVCSQNRISQEFFASSRRLWEYASDTSKKVAIVAAQLMGGHGFLQSHPVERWVREIQFLGQYGDLAEGLAEAP
jgi:hypothetical protein